jgi:hypothetical protein
MIKKEMISHANINEVFKNLDLETTEKRNNFQRMNSSFSASSSSNGKTIPSFSLSHKTNILNSEPEVSI